MKRSEAEAAFMNIIKEYKVLGFGVSSALASRLITLAMNIGMLPPERMITRVNSAGHSYETEENSWEPENEQK